MDFAQKRPERVIILYIFNYDHEFIATKTGYNAALAESFFDFLRKEFYNLIAHCVTVIVVHILEVVDVYKRERKRPFVFNQIFCVINDDIARIKTGEIVCF